MKIKEATGKPGIVFPTANNYGGWMFSCLAWSYGVDFMEKGEDGKWKATFNTPEAAEALRYMKDLKWKYDVLPNNAIIDGTEFYKTFAIGNAAMLMWYFIYYPDQTGLLNMLLGKMGLAPYAWLNDPRLTIVGIIIYSQWKGFPGSMLLYFAALQSVSVEQYEAALIDGAGPWKRLWFVTRPAMEGLLLLNLVRQIISVFQIMEQPLAMTGGGPNGASVSLSYQLYQYGFNSGGKGTGQAMALGVIIFLILIVFTLFYFWLNKKVEDRL